MLRGITFSDVVYKNKMNKSVFFHGRKDMLEEEENGWTSGLSPLAFMFVLGFIVFGSYLLILDLVF